MYQYFKSFGKFIKLFHFRMDNAYSQLALCGPSRTSLLTSRLPERMQILSNTNLNWRENAKIKDVYSLPQYYKEHGYHTKSIGKIFHPIGKVIYTSIMVSLGWSGINLWHLSWPKVIATQ